MLEKRIEAIRKAKHGYPPAELECVFAEARAALSRSKPLQPCLSHFVPNDLKTQKMCAEPVRKESYLLKYVSDLVKIQEMCTKAVNKERCVLKYVPHHLKAQRMCVEAVSNEF